MISRQDRIHGDDDEIRFWQLVRQIRADIRLCSLDGGGELLGNYRAIRLFSSWALFFKSAPLSLPEIQQIYIPSILFYTHCTSWTNSPVSLPNSVVRARATSRVPAPAAVVPTSRKTTSTRVS